MQERTCSHCGEQKSVAAFSLVTGHQNRWKSWCKACASEERRLAYLADPERRKRYNADWARRNPEKRAAIQRRWEAKNAGRRTVDPVKARERRRRWSAANPEVHLENERRRRARRRGTAVAILTTEQIALKMAYWGFRCWMCGGPFEHVDHVKPLAKGGAHILANLRPSCVRCNQQKFAQWPWPTGARRADSGDSHPLAARLP